MDTVEGVVGGGVERVITHTHTPTQTRARTHRRERGVICRGETGWGKRKASHTGEGVCTRRGRLLLRGRSPRQAPRVEPAAGGPHHTTPPLPLQQAGEAGRGYSSGTADLREEWVPPGTTDPGTTLSMCCSARK